MLLIAERLTPVTFLISSAGIPFALLSTIIFLTSTGTIFITSASYYTISFLFCLYWNCCKVNAIQFAPEKKSITYIVGDEELKELRESNESEGVPLIMRETEGVLRLLLSLVRDAGSGGKFATNDVLLLTVERHIRVGYKLHHRLAVFLQH